MSHPMIAHTDDALVGRDPTDEELGGNMGSPKMDLCDTVSKRDTVVTQLPLLLRRRLLNTERDDDTSKKKKNPKGTWTTHTAGGGVCTGAGFETAAAGALAATSGSARA